MASSSSSGELNDSLCDAVYERISLFDGQLIKREEFLAICPLCKRFGNYFHCVNCIRNGDFVHSKHKHLERFADKKLHSYQIDEQKTLILQRYEQALSKKLKAENTKRNINLYKEKIRLLKECIKFRNEEIAKREKSFKEMKCQNEYSAYIQHEFAEKINDMQRNKDKYISEIEFKQKELYSLRDALQRVIRRQVKDLVAYIFPINKVENTQSHKDSDSEDQCAELEEAQKTTYVRGQWVIAGSSIDNSQYSIVAPCIPSNGDYSAYTFCCSEHTDGLISTEKDKFNKHYVACGISAALTFTAQLVCILAFYLNVHVPKHLSYSEFCGQELTKEEFLHKVAKLNANIIHLCLSQKVDPSLLSSHQTIPNLLLLLDPTTSDLGRFEPVDFKEDVMESIEESISKDMIPNEDSDSENCEDIETDFVHLSEEEDIPHISEIVPNEPTSHQPSFASSVMSFWRAATRQK